jgi:hypothetical protein
MRGHDSVIASGAGALLEPPVATIAVLAGLILLLWGLGGWLNRWVAPAARLLGGMHPAWWGAVLICLGAASGLAGGALLLPSSVRPVLLGCSGVSLAVAAPSLLAGVVLRAAHRRGDLDERARPRLPRRLVRVLLTGQFPAGGPVGWPPRPTQPSQERDAQQERC